MEVTPFSIVTDVIESLYEYQGTLERLGYLVIAPEPDIVNAPVLVLSDHFTLCPQVPEYVANCFLFTLFTSLFLAGFKTLEIFDSIDSIEKSVEWFWTIEEFCGIITEALF